jgi:adenine-specific DNA methylase
LIATCDEESQKRWVAVTKEKLDPRSPAHQNFLRFALLDFIADFANWDNSNRREYLESARALTQSAHESLGGQPGTRPLVVDPFAGGGSIPLEALRVGADAFASDLNPVAVLLNKVVLEYIPRYGQKLADEVREWGAWVKEAAERELAQFYPRDPDGSTPIAYLWARTITCEGPGCGAEIPLLKGLWVATTGTQSVALKLVPKPRAKRVDFEIIEGANPVDVADGTVKRGSASCPCCGFTTPVASVRRQLAIRKGGAESARLFAIVTTHPDRVGRSFRVATRADQRVAESAAVEMRNRIRLNTSGIDLIPSEPTPEAQGHRAVSSCRVYGIDTWADLFTPRQALINTTLVRVISSLGDQKALKHNPEFSQAIRTCLALVVSRMADGNSSLTRWQATRLEIANTFGRQAIPMVWDFAEANPFCSASRSLESMTSWISKVIEREAAIQNCGKVSQSDATSHPLPDDSAQIFFTDPPYYDSVPYADLADFFYVWLRRCLRELQSDIFANDLTPKTDQAIVWHPQSSAERATFESRMTRSMAEGRRVLVPSGIGMVVFAHKSTAGWEAQIKAMLDANWTLTASWPIDTERNGRTNSVGTASLASSIHLICRPRENSDGTLRSADIGDWRDILQELPRRIHDWMPRLAGEGVVGADAIFACLGPALEIFSRYSRVEKASGEQVTLREYLEHVWAAVAEEALKMIFQGADAKGFEEDSRLTAMWLWTLSTGNGTGNGKSDEDDDDEEKSTAVSGYTLEYDAARKIAQGLGAHLETLSSLVEVKGDKAILLPVAARTRHLFGKVESHAPIRKPKRDPQMNLLASLQEVQEETGGWGEKNAPPAGSTVLDRVHQAMILFAANRGEAIKRFLVEDGVGKDHRFWKLAQSLSALYPKDSDEKRWVDGVLGRKKSLGF